MAAQGGADRQRGPREVSILFVCLGNICRSPMAQAVLEEQLKSWKSEYIRVVKVDSAGMGDWHTGAAPDSRTMDVLRQHGINGFKHAARQIRALPHSDLAEFDVVVGMDDENVEQLLDARVGDNLDKRSSRALPAVAPRTRSRSRAEARSAAEARARGGPEVKDRPKGRARLGDPWVKGRIVLFGAFAAHAPKAEDAHKTGGSKTGGTRDRAGKASKAKEEPGEPGEPEEREDEEEGEGEGESEGDVKDEESYREGEQVADPYYQGGQRGFDAAYAQCLRFGSGLLAWLEALERRDRASYS